MLGVAALVPACPLPAPEISGPPPLVQARVSAGYPVLDPACEGPVAEPTHLVVTTTDFHTGAVGLVALETHEVTADLALASSDAVPIVSEGRVFIVNRFGFDYIDELDPANELDLIHEWSIVAATTAAPANPHGLLLDEAGRAWVPLHGAGELQGFGFPTLQAAQVKALVSLDLADYADPDGVPELSLALRCGAVGFVSAERIDRGSWLPTTDALLIPVGLDPDDPSLFAFDGASPGAIHLLGDGTGAWRLDPGDPDGHTLIMLNAGLERVDLAAGATSWWVPRQRFEDAGYARLQLSGFDLDSLGRAWLTAASPDFSSFALIRVEGEGPGAALVVEVDGLQSVTGDLEIVADIAYVADTTIGASGLRAFDLSQVPVTELADSPLKLGLPPMSVAPLHL